MIQFRFPLIMSIILFFFLQGCFVSKSSKTLMPLPSFVLKEMRRDVPGFVYRGFVIKGSLYYFSKKRNFRGSFVLKGNRDYPWIMELRWAMGNLISMGRVVDGKCELYVLHDNTIYESQRFSSLFGLLGFSPSISPRIWLDLLTGDWKKTIPSPVKAFSFPGGYRFVFRGYFVSELDIFLKGGEIEETVLRFPFYRGYIKIYSRGRMEFVSPTGERSILKIKEVSLLSSPLPMNQLKVKFPSGAKRIWVGK